MLLLNLLSSNRVLQIQYSDGFNKMGTVRWEVALCLMAVFTIVYFALWKGVKSSGKVRLPSCKTQVPLKPRSSSKKLKISK